MRLAVTRADGGLSIINVISAPDGLDALVQKHNIGAVSWREVPDDFGLDRTFRNAWKDSGGDKPAVDMPKARDIHRDRLRRARIAPLADLDVEYQKADEDGDQQRKREVAAMKQRLRDLPSHPAIEAASTPEELKALTLEALL